MWDVEYTNEFHIWWQSLGGSEQDSILYSVGLLEQAGPALGRPHVDTVSGSRFPNMKELRCQHRGRPYRIFFAFDPRRCAILLVGGDKTGKPNFYRKMIPVADRLYAMHLEELKKEGLK